ncbi:MAG TPA: lamin tail domain-containing protein [Candidatus Paceibacterota bacterium]|nr:lamin tail domain-containing protein [Candidatus Paceibacterota bacterium]
MVAGRLGFGGSIASQGGAMIGQLWQNLAGGGGFSPPDDDDDGFTASDTAFDEETSTEHSFLDVAPDLPPPKPAAKGSPGSAKSVAKAATTVQTGEKPFQPPATAPVTPNNSPQGPPPPTPPSSTQPVTPLPGGNSSNPSSSPVPAASAGVVPTAAAPTTDSSTLATTTQTTSVSTSTAADQVSTSSATSSVPATTSSSTASTFCAATHVVIAAVQIAGPATSNDFVRLFNPTSATVDLGGWRLRKKSSGGTDASLKVLGSGASIAAGGSFVWANSANGFAASVGADVSSTETIAADNSVALLNASGTIVDEVAWGNGTNQYVEGSPFPTNPAANQILSRTLSGGIPGDSDNNAADFTLH